MGLISSIRVMSGMVSVLCFVLAFVFFGFAIASFTLFPVMIFFLIFAGPEYLGRVVFQGTEVTSAGNVSQRRGLTRKGPEGFGLGTYRDPDSRIFPDPALLIEEMRCGTSAIVSAIRPFRLFRSVVKSFLFHRFASGPAAGTDLSTGFAFATTLS